MNTLKDVAIGIVFVALLGAMIVGSALDIGRSDPFTGNPEQDREYCYNTPPSLMNGNELRHCDWLREVDEHRWERFDTDSSGEFPVDYDDP